ncbi:MAG: hypothetical protein GY740_02085 [Gammaproteobacteria bacterium]|nr:hypothetical protein [Gammaproteobacteria bacterium]
MLYMPWEYRVYDPSEKKATVLEEESVLLLKAEKGELKKFVSYEARLNEELKTGNLADVRSEFDSMGSRWDEAIRQAMQQSEDDIADNAVVAPACQHDDDDDAAEADDAADPLLGEKHVGDTDVGGDIGLAGGGDEKGPLLPFQVDMSNVDLRPSVAALNEKQRKCYSEVRWICRTST